MDNKIIKLVNGDLIIGDASRSDNGTIVIDKPYTIKDFGQGPCVLPYELDRLLEPMTHIAFEPYNMLWLKNLSDFPVVESQYISATTGIDL